MTVDDLFARLFQDYVTIAPQAGEILGLFRARESNVINDHVAFRTFALPGMRIDDLASAFTKRGYVKKDHYVFADKHLDADYFMLRSDSQQRSPKVFISELDVSKLSAPAQAIIHRISAEVRLDFAEDGLLGKRPWDIDESEYELLLKESEYAAWLYVFGFRANHFTVSVDHLTSFDSLEDVNRFLHDHGYKLNTAGGEIKGTPADLLEQSATLAADTAVHFPTGPRHLPSCYYEFARRYRGPDGNRFEGFVPSNATRIFESTNVHR